MCFPLALSMAPANAAEHGYVGIRPLAESAADARDTTLLVRVEPGSSVTRKVAVSNTTSQALNITLSVGAAELRGGDFVFGEPGVENDTSRWAQVDPGSVLVGPGQERVVTIRFVVPADSPEGARYGVVWAQPPAADAGGVQVVNRVGVRVAMLVGSLATTGAQLRLALGVALGALALGGALVVLGRGLGRRRRRAQVARRLKPWPKKPPLGRAWA